MIHGQYFILHDFAAPSPLPNLFEITYITAGNGLRIINGKKQKITKGNFFLSDPENPAVLRDIKGLEAVRILFLATFIDQVFPNVRSFRDLARSFLLRFSREIGTTFFIENIYTDSENNIRRIMERILREDSDGRDGHLELTRCYVLEIILSVFRECSEKRDPSEYELTHHTFVRTYDYCQKNFASNIKLGELCRDLHYSLPYLSARFKEIHGCTFTELIQRFRVEEACRLLVSGNKKIAEVSRQVGYSDTQSFFKVFKKHMGITPLQYRKQNIHFQYD
ncbi:MAG: helix-turn-helix domain-containing protein [Ruminococcaceae bacterium]|nr:helix-turn-helix domain-containing protein [Oscillospiraceae bacterium]